MSGVWQYAFLGMIFGACCCAGFAAGLGVLAGLYWGGLAIATVIRRKRWEQARLAEHKALYDRFDELHGQKTATTGDDDPTLTTGGIDE